MLDNKTEQKWPLTKRSESGKSSRVISFLSYYVLVKKCGRSGKLRPSALFRSRRKAAVQKQRSCGGKFPITTAAVFLRNEKVPFFHGTGRKRKRNLGGLLTCVSIDGPVSLLGIIQWLTFVTAGHLDTYSAGSVGNRTPFSCSAPPPARLPGHQIRYLLLLKR